MYSYRHVASYATYVFVIIIVTNMVLDYDKIIPYLKIDKREVIWQLPDDSIYRSPWNEGP